MNKHWEAQMRHEHFSSEEIQVVDDCIFEHYQAIGETPDQLRSLIITKIRNRSLNSIDQIEDWLKQRVKAKNPASKINIPVSFTQAVSYLSELEIQNAKTRFLQRGFTEDQWTRLMTLTIACAEKSLNSFAFLLEQVLLDVQRVGYDQAMMHIGGRGGE